MSAYPEWSVFAAALLICRFMTPGRRSSVCPRSFNFQRPPPGQALSLGSFAEECIAAHGPGILL